jgi:hypothetical protein
MSESLYPPGYRDPEWDGTEEGFREIVLPARIKAVTQELNRRCPLPDGMRLEWEAESISS